MGKTEFVVIFLAICMFVSGLGASQGMGGSKAYDQSGYNWMGTPVYSDDGVGTAAEDYFRPYGFAGDEEGSSGSRINAVSLQIEPADPLGEGLVVGGDDSLMNQIYLQMGNQLLTQGTALLGEEYTLWVRVSMRGSFQLYDHNSLLLSRDSTHFWLVSDKRHLRQLCWPASPSLSNRRHIQQ